MPATERHIRIHAPIERVWEVLVDIPGQSRWMRDLRDITIRTPGPPAVGTIAIGTVHMFGLRQSDPIEITALDAPGRYAIRHHGGFRGWGEFRLAPIDDGRATHVRWREELRASPEAFPLVPWLTRRPLIGRPIHGIVSWLASAADPLFGPVFSAVFRADLRRLRRLVETGTV